MTRVLPPRFSLSDRTSLFSGVVMAACFAAMVTLPILRGPPLKSYVVFFLVASAAYVVTVLCLDRAALSLGGIWAFAILFRLTVLLTAPPTLSDDVYRYIWDGRLANAGISPYAYSVDSPLLDAFDLPERALVNNEWMASPYLPVAQAVFAAAYRVIPASPFAFQVIAVLLDLSTGLVVIGILHLLNLPLRRGLIYLWNPLVIVEFAHGAHVDALMTFLMMVSLWALVSGKRRRTAGQRSESALGMHVLGPDLLSPVALAAATLTKGIPALLLTVVGWCWGWRRTLLFAGLVVAVLVPFGLGAGWGLTGPLNGEGLFGALRIYGTRWNYNGGLYHWLEVALSGYRTPGAVPPEIVGETPIRVAKLAAATVLALVLIVVASKARGCADHVRTLRLAAIPLGAYLLLTTTLHPWYVTVIIPLLPFWLRRAGETTPTGRFIWPWIYLSAAVSLSYFTYLDPANLREYEWVRLVEYMPTFLLLMWAAWPAIGGAREPAAN
jgi:alpha-1,6-mannosyltransferase